MATQSDIAKLARSISFDAVLGKPRKPLKHLKLVVFGAGVIGGSVGAWIAEKYDNIYFHDLPPMNAALRKNGFLVYPEGDRQAAQRIDVKVIDDLSAAEDADVVLIGVKNYSLEKVAQTIQSKLGDRPIVIGMQNGLENQRILPKYFSKVAYCVISYNAWMDEPGVIGYQKRGPLHIGTKYNELQSEMQEISRIFNLGVETVVTTDIVDAAHSKLVINLTNSLTTLVGLSVRPISDQAVFQKLLTNLLSEGVKIVKAAGYKESRLGGMPPWIKIQAGATLPRFLTKGMFARNVKKMVLSSMAQDVLQRGGSESELETLNGYILELARRYNVRAPYNQTIYDICKREFTRPGFSPLDVKDIWREVQGRL